MSYLHASQTIINEAISKLNVSQQPDIDNRDKTMLTTVKEINFAKWFKCEDWQEQIFANDDS